MWDNLHKLKDALDGDEERVPAGGSKGQAEARSEIYGETKKVEEIQAKGGWSERVSPCHFLCDRGSSEYDQLLDQRRARWG